MKKKEKISFEEICGIPYKIRALKASDNGKAAFTHYFYHFNLCSLHQLSF